VGAQTGLTKIFRCACRLWRKVFDRSQHDGFSRPSLPDIPVQERRRWTERKGLDPLDRYGAQDVKPPLSIKFGKGAAVETKECNELSQRNFDFTLDLITGNICEPGGEISKQNLKCPLSLGRSIRHETDPR
jgi:hypothetical protein